MGIESALGLIQAPSFPAIVGVADTMLKSAGVTLVGFEKIGSGYCTAIVRGGTAEVRLAVETGAEAARQFFIDPNQVSTLVIPRPLANLDAVLPISSRLSKLGIEPGYSRLSNYAVGLLETRGFPALVAACDMMLKSAEVELVAYETVGDALCTAIIRGTVANVAVAVEAGVYEAERVGELHSVAVITRPLDDLEKALPLSKLWLEQQPQPIALPLATVAEAERQLVGLPELERADSLAAIPVEVVEPE